MSGLLRRLAGRALGQPGATQLHALARLPFQALPAGMIELPAPWLAEAQPSASPQLSEYQAPEQQSSTRTAAPHTPPGSRSPQAPTATSPRPQSAAAAVQTAAMPESFEPATASSPPFQPVEPRRISPGIQEVSAQASLPRITALQPAPLFRPFAEEAPKPTTSSAARRSSTDVASPSTILGTPEQPTASLSLPEAVLPPAPLLALKHASPNSTVRTTEQQREPDEVHVHIGRIEITAVQQPAPAKRASRKGQAPLSLDDYLARRKGDGA